MSNNFDPLAGLPEIEMVIDPVEGELARGPNGLAVYLGGEWVSKGLNDTVRLGLSNNQPSGQNYVIERPSKEPEGEPYETVQGGRFLITHKDYAFGRVYKVPEGEPDTTFTVSPQLLEEIADKAAGIDDSKAEEIR